LSLRQCAGGEQQDNWKKPAAQPLRSAPERNIRGLGHAVEW
jgi:hypothetical protein